MERQAWVLLLSCYITCLTVCKAQVPHVGKCPTVKPQDTFDVAQYLGKWYEIKRFPFVLERGACLRAEYSLRPDGKVKVDNRYIENGKENRAIGEAYQPDPQKEPAVLSVTFGKSPPAQYKVVETDYKTYSLVFSCESIASVANLQFAWILSRELTLDQEVTDRLVKELGSFNVDTDSFIVTNQTGCPN